MTRIQKQISLPSEYWKAIESSIDNRLIRSRGDALIGILEKVYPHLSKVIITPQPKQTEHPIVVNQPNRTEPHKSFSRNGVATDDLTALCACGHPELVHCQDGCLGDGGLCECKVLVEEKS